MITERDIPTNIRVGLAVGLVAVAGLTPDVRVPGAEQACYDLTSTYRTEEGKSIAHTTRGRCYELGSVPRVFDCEPVIRQSINILGFKIRNIGAEAVIVDGAGCNAIRLTIRR